MSYTPYTTSIPIAQDALNSLTHLLQIAEQQPNAASLPTSSLHPDMKPLTFQVEIAATTAVKLLARLSGTEPVQLEGEVVTFKDMFARIERAQEALAAGSREVVEARAGEGIVMGKDREGNVATYSGDALVYGYSLPTLFFHVSTAYGILRKEGVPLAKSDYMDSFGARFVAE